MDVRTPTLEECKELAELGNEIRAEFDKMFAKLHGRFGTTPIHFCFSACIVADQYGNVGSLGSVYGGRAGRAESLATPENLKSNLDFYRNVPDEYDKSKYKAWQELLAFTRKDCVE